MVVVEGRPSAATSTPPQISLNLSLDGGRRFLSHLELLSNSLERRFSDWVRCTVVIGRRVLCEHTSLPARTHSPSEKRRSFFEKHRRQLAVLRENSGALHKTQCLHHPLCSMRSCRAWGTDRLPSAYGSRVYLIARFRKVQLPSLVRPRVQYVETLSGSDGDTTGYYFLFVVYPVCTGSAVS